MATRVITLHVTHSPGYGGSLRFRCSDGLILPDSVDSFDELLWHLGEEYGYTYQGPHPFRDDSFIFQRAQVEEPEEPYVRHPDDPHP
jgi:hypothetical protein